MSYEGFQDISNLEYDRIIFLPLDEDAEHELEKLSQGIMKCRDKNTYTRNYFYMDKSENELPEGTLYYLLDDEIKIYELPCGYLVSYIDEDMYHPSDQLFIKSEKEVVIFALRKMAHSIGSSCEIVEHISAIIKMIYQGRIIVWFERD